MTLVVDDNKQIKAHKVILAAVSQLSLVISTDMSSRSNSHFLFALVNEFISAWALGGTASLSLTTSNGQATVGYNCTLGHPGAPHFSSPPSPPHPNPLLLHGDLVTVALARGRRIASERPASERPATRLPGPVLPLPLLQCSQSPSLPMCQ